MLSGRDVVIQSQTGTGKTAAFVLPIVDRLEPVPGRIDVLVLTPTRELAQQVAGEFERLGSTRGVQVVAVFGGAGFDTLYATCNDRVYQRRVGVVGANAWAAPVLPKPPRL
jgi:ATP-dependent RNA helicase DeaD